MLSGVVGVGVGVWYGSRAESLTLTDIHVRGGDTISHEVVRAATAELLDGTYYRLVPRRFAWTYPAAAITARVKDIERVKDVTVERPSGTTVSVSFTEYYPAALWCSSATSTECMYVDADGYTFAEAPSLDGGVLLRLSDSRQAPTSSTQGFSPEFIQTQTALTDRLLEQLELRVAAIARTSDTEAVYYLAGGGQLRINTHTPIAETFNNLVTVLSTDEFQHLEPGNFQYIDLRFGNKVFVNEELAAPQGDTASSSVATTTAASTAD